jgi:hypothetical protein
MSPANELCLLFGGVSRRGIRTYTDSKAEGEAQAEAISLTPESAHTLTVGKNLLRFFQAGVSKWESRVHSVSTTPQRCMRTVTEISALNDSSS